MKVAVLADVHGNFPALEAVVEDLRANGAEKVWHLGDAVGYGAEPAPCLQLLSDLGALLIAGNHEAALSDEKAAAAFSPLAREAILWTAERLSPDLRAALASLPLSARPLPQVFLFHGLPGNPGAYLRTQGEAQAVMDFLAGSDPRLRIGFFGHTHHRRVFTRLGSAPPVFLPVDGDLLLAPGRAYLVNPGSVGQPRDGDPRARYLLYHPSSGRILFREVEYDVALAQTAILRAGLPPALAARLSQGI